MTKREQKRSVRSSGIGEIGGYINFGGPPNAGIQIPTLGIGWGIGGGYFTGVIDTSPLRPWTIK